MRGRRASYGWLLAAALGTSLLGGCVERRYVIYSDPPGAIVRENGRTVGAAPVDRPFQYYGDYQFELIRDGYQTHVVLEPMRRPWYGYFPIDFFAENVWPFTIRDKRTLKYTLEPMSIVPPEAVIERGGQLRQRGQEIGTVPPGALPGPELPLPPRTTPFPP